MSKYLTNQDPWWVPLQISTDNDGDFLLAFNTTSITKQFETKPPSVRLNSRTSIKCHRKRI